MADPVGEAFVVIRPDLTLFRAELLAGVKAAMAQANVVGATGAGGGSSGPAATATAAINRTTVATGAATSESVQLANAQAAVASANSAVARTTATYNAVLAKEGADAEKTAIALSALTAATARQTAANERLNLVQNPVQKSLLGTTGAANAARGAFIGLSRITPLTVFGLQATGVAAIIAGTAIAASVKSAAQFEQQLSTFRVVAGATATELDAVRREAIALGGDTTLAGQSAGDAATAMTELAKAGLSVADSMAAARGVLQLAGAAGIGAGDAAKIVAGQLNAFKLSGDQATRVVGLLAAASVEAQGEIQDFSYAFQQVSSVAESANVSIEQQTALLTELAKAGIQGADAGTSLRTFLLRLVPTTKQAAEFTKVLGVELDGTKTEGEQLASIIEQYRTQLEKLTPIQQTNVLNQIFGQDAYRASTVIFSQNRGELDKLIKTLSTSTAAEDLNAAKAEGLAGAAAGLQNQLSTLGIQLGKVVDGPLEAFVRGLSDTIDNTALAISSLGDLVAAVGAIKIPVINIPIKVLFTTGPIPKIIAGLLAAPAVAASGPLGPVVAATIAFNKLVGGGESDAEREARLAKIPEPKPSGRKDRRFGDAAREAKKKQATKEALALRARVQRQIDETQGSGPGAKVDPDVTAPQKLQVAQLNAQIAGSLQRELKADLLIEDYFEKRISIIPKKTKRYLKVLKALQAANAAVRSVQGQIASENKAASDAAEAERKKNAKDKQDELEAAKAAELERFQLTLDRLDLRIQAADQTENKIDDVRRRRDKIKVLDKRIAFLEAQKKKTTEEKRAIIALRKERLGLLAEIKGIQQDSAGGNGFTLSDFFKAATDEFNQYASNISSSPLTGGGATRTLIAARGAQFLGGKMSPADRAKLEKMSETNRLLGAILAVDTAQGRHDLPGQHTGEIEYGANYYKLPPGQRAMERARRMGSKVLPQP